MNPQIRPWDERKPEVRVAVSSGEGKTAGQHDPAQRESARERAGEQGLLFDERPSTLPADIGYRGPTACAAAGITYRQLDYWARTELVRPSIRPAHGSGSQRLYSFRDIIVLKVVPAFSEFYGNFNKELPLSTRVIVKRVMTSTDTRTSRKTT